MTIFDPLLGVPPEIVEAANKVARWFAERGIIDWKLGRLQSRNDRSDVVEFTMTSAPAPAKVTPEDTARVAEFYRTYPRDRDPPEDFGHGDACYICEEARRRAAAKSP